MARGPVGVSSLDWPARAHTVLGRAATRTRAIVVQPGRFIRIAPSTSARLAVGPIAGGVAARDGLP